MRVLVCTICSTVGFSLLAGRFSPAVAALLPAAAAVLGLESTNASEIGESVLVSVAVAGPQLGAWMAVGSCENLAVGCAGFSSGLVGLAVRCVCVRGTMKHFH